MKFKAIKKAVAIPFVLHGGSGVAAGKIKKAKITSVMVFDGLSRVEVQEVNAGDIVAVAGIEKVRIGETIADAENPIQLPPILIDEPTVKMSFSVNTSPFAGKEGRDTGPGAEGHGKHRDPPRFICVRVLSDE